MGNRILKSVVFLWSGLPDYGARLIRGFIERSNVNVQVVATKPSVPIEGMERSLGQAVHWIEAKDSNISWERLGLSAPDVLFQGGWAQQSFCALAELARSRGASVILMNDQNFTGGFRQLVIDPLRFKFTQRKNFSAALVPGTSGMRYAQALGFPNDRIAQGLYGADPKIFCGGLPLQQRPKKFLYVGQLVARKNVLNLVRGFIAFARDFPEWSLEIVGSGELAKDIPAHEQIHLGGFIQPHALAERLRNARCLVLPSLEEHWGLVVHEAVSCGCALALAQTVGSKDDFARTENSIVFSPHSATRIEKALRLIASWKDVDWQEAEKKSRYLALNFGPARFAESVQSLIDRCLPCA
jgi:glycosyltransferase involved in cell wall biosynthesis